MDIKIPNGGDGGEGAIAVVTLVPDSATMVSRSGNAGSVLLNGMQLGPEAAPLLHGDRLAVDGAELLYANEAELGDTVELPAVTSASTAEPSPGASEARSKGRLVSLVDGREFRIPSTGLTIGREVSCDVVLSAPTVSRQHATLSATPRGYLLVDSSRNGVFVNDRRVGGELALSNGDTVRVGTEDFRFYASSEPSGEQLDLSSVPGLQTTGVIRAMKRPVLAETTSEDRDRSEVPVLAELEVTNEGPTKGMRHSISFPLVHVGRAEHNDVVIADESVSEAHAKLQRRDGTWFLIDLDSTNGTYAGGRRLSEEVRLTAGTEIRFGGVKMVFRPSDAAPRISGSTRVIAGLRAPDPKRASAATPRFTQAAEKQPPSEAGSSRVVSRFLLLLLAAALGFAVYTLVRGGLR